jgi:replicative DNA helicase
VGACLAYPTEGIPRARALVRPEDFDGPMGAVFQTALDLYDAHGTLDLPTVSAELTRRGLLAVVGGEAGLTALYDNAGTAATIGYHAKALREAAGRHRVVQALESCHALALADGIPLADLQSRVADTVTRACTSGTEAESFTTAQLADLMLEPRRPGASTGLPCLDAALGGFHAGHLIVVAGRPGMGKSTLGIQAAMHHTGEGKGKALFISCEMSAREVGEWALPLVAGLPRNAVSPVTVNVNRKAFEAHGLFVTTPSAPSLADVQAMIRRHHTAHGISLVILDHIGKVEGPGETRNQQIGAVARGLKATAKALRIPVVALCQLNRNVDHRDIHRPQLSDLRESGDIEQEADVVMFLWREKETRTVPLAVPTVLSIEKGRFGGNGEFAVVLHRALGRFEQATAGRGDA